MSQKEMGPELWAAVDRYIEETSIPHDPVLSAALAASEAAGLPAIAVTPSQGKLLWLLARMLGAQNILEIGTPGGYSTIWLARALPAGGRLISLELERKHADVAQANIARAELAHTVEIRLGRALDSLPALALEGRGPFDFVFIDADKANISEYFAWSLKLTRPGSVIVVDNVVRKGAVLDASSSDSNVLGVRRFNERLSQTKNVSATTLQTVGSKGYDGLTLALVLGD